MKPILLYFQQLCLLKGSPELLPTSRELLLFTLVVYFLVSITTGYIAFPEIGLFQLLSLVISDILLVTSGTWLLLTFKKVESRFISTLLAILGCSIIISLVSLPLDLMFSNIASDNQEKERMMVTFAQLIILCWWLAVVGNILSHAGNTSFIQGFALALTIEIVYAVAINSLLPNHN